MSLREGGFRHAGLTTRTAWAVVLNRPWAAPAPCPCWAPTPSLVGCAFSSSPVSWDPHAPLVKSLLRPGSFLPSCEQMILGKCLLQPPGYLCQYTQAVLCVPIWLCVRPPQGSDLAQQTQSFDRAGIIYSVTHSANILPHPRKGLSAKPVRSKRRV